MTWFWPELSLYELFWRLRAANRERFRAALLIAGVALAASFSTAGCGGDGRSSGPPGVGTGGTGGQPSKPLEFLSLLRTIEDYAALSGEGAEVKYLAIVDGAEPPDVFSGAECLFQNTAKYPYHLSFLRTFPEYAELSAERYSDFVLRRASRVMWGGGLKLLLGTPHPTTGIAGVLAYTVYTESAPSELFSVEELIEVDRRLKANIAFASAILAFMPDGLAQTRAVVPSLSELGEAGVAVLDPASARPALTAETYSEGEGYGYLKLVTGDGKIDAGPRDVLIVEAAPNDLGLVAGLVTARPQSLGSHLNLRLREKGVPNAAVPGVLENGLILGLANHLVHVTAHGAMVVIEPAELEDATDFWSSRQPPLGAPPSDLDRTQFVSLDELGATDAPAYGVKAANLGDLAQLLPEANHVDGFAIPFRAYVDFLEASGLDRRIDELLADPMRSTDALHKRNALEALRDEIRASELSLEFREALALAIFESYGDAGATTRLRFRSSTNAEDLPGVSGAGLYDSRSGCLADDLDGDSLGPSACLSPADEAYLEAELERREQELVEHPERAYLADIIQDLQGDLGDEKSAYRAVLRVWASLWNERAFDDREYYGIDHRRTYMGVAVHPTFVGERLESVIVTNLEPDANEPLYRVVSQLGEVGVVGPSDPTAVTEILTFRRGASGEATDVSLVQPSSLVAEGDSLWPPAALDELAALLFITQDHFAANVYPTLDALSLDLEVDVTRDGRTVIKQVRPYTP